MAKNVPTAEEIKCDIVIAYRPLGKHSVARGSRGVKHRDFRGIKGQTEGKNNMGIEIYKLNLAQIITEGPPDIWQYSKAKYTDHFNMNYFLELLK